jgi:3-phosphoshikimate 1-carboxyvinyltransferase
MAALLGGGSWPPALALRGGRPLSGTVSAPGSKSHANRALVVAALAAGHSQLSGLPASDDVQRMTAGLEALGAAIAVDGGTCTVEGAKGYLAGGDVEVDAGLSGTTFRFLCAVATLSSGMVTLTGRPGLLARPMRPLVEALSRLGCSVSLAEGGTVVVGPGPPRGGTITVECSTSSQFASALLLVSPYAQGDTRIKPIGLGAAGYLDMTMGLMRRWGAEVSRGNEGLVVRAGVPYRGRYEPIAGDASAAAQLFVLAVATGGEVKVTNLRRADDQPDLASLHLLERMGATFEWRGEDAVAVRGPDHLEPLDADLAATPDLLPAMAVLASLARGRSTFTGLGVTRHHETDRVGAVCTELAKLGVPASPEGDRLTIEGGSPRGPASIFTYGDHRMAMAFAGLGARVAGITIEDPGCVAKTYPSFWADAACLGLAWEAT